MNIDKPMIEHGPLDISEVDNILETFTEADWNSDRAFRNKLTGPRPGASLILLTNSDFNRPRRWQLEVREGYISVYKRPPWKLLGESTQKLLDKIISNYYPNTDVVRLQYALLPQGAEIPRHSDIGILKFLHRLHVPITTHKDVIFTVENINYKLERGRLYELNNVLEHSVKNNSPINRVHLLIDLMRHQDARVLRYENYNAMTNADNNQSHQQAISS